MDQRVEKARERSEKMSAEQLEPLEELKAKIAAITNVPVSEHVGAYEELHGDLQRALSEIEGL